MLISWFIKSNIFFNFYIFLVHENFQKTFILIQKSNHIFVWQKAFFSFQIWLFFLKKIVLKNFEKKYNYFTMKVFFHLDIDAFFVSAHRTIDKKLIGKPVVVANLGLHSIVAAASYEAKKFGVKVPMPLHQAKKLVPNLIAIKPDFNLYTKLANNLFEFITSNYTNQIEVASIDECYIDVSQLWVKYKSPLHLAKHMQDNILKSLHLPSSIGIGDNKFVAKMASPLNKPYGLTVIKPGNFAKTFWSLDVEKCLGVGKSVAQVLKKHDINTIGQLALADENLLTFLFKKRGLILKQNANGFGDNQLTFAHNNLKSVGNSLTFAHNDKKERDDILQIIDDLSSIVSTRAKARNLMGYVVNVAIKTSNHDMNQKVSKQITLKTPICEQKDLYKQCVLLFDELWNGQTIKFLAVTLHKLIDIFKDTIQSSLFHQQILSSQNLNDNNQVYKIINEINYKMHQKVLMTTHEKLVNIKKQRQQSRYLWSSQNLKHHDK